MGDGDTDAGQERHMTDVLTDQPTANGATPGGQPTGEGIAVGDRVEVRRRFDEEWVSGFEVAEAVDGGYTVRRRSDGEVLPAVFPADAVRAERRRRRAMWWY